MQMTNRSLPNYKGKKVDNLKIGFIGGGNMASSLIGGLINNGTNPSSIFISEPNSERRQQLGANFSVSILTDNAELISKVDVVVLAVKPQMLHQVCDEISQSTQQKQPLVISIAAGIRINDINRWLGGNCAIVRTMPNTPALIQSGATGLFANKVVKKSQHECAESIMRAVGLTLWVKNEADLDIVTALSGSGPAYIFLFIELLQNAAQELGLDSENARLLALQTAFGASKMALESSDDCEQLRKNVTSPGGTTERALEIFSDGQLDKLISKAMSGARDRAKELADHLGAN